MGIKAREQRSRHINKSNGVENVSEKLSYEELEKIVKNHPKFKHIPTNLLDYCLKIWDEKPEIIENYYNNKLESDKKEKKSEDEKNLFGTPNKPAIMNKREIYQEGGVIIKHNDKSDSDAQVNEVKMDSLD